ncbi:MAG: GHKL domain-containing protein, partial [Candidatus Aureabacteria bacterium]|nr:GHKL domain-containing protein [Candidatus Auribacterota bacterium]
YYLNLKLGSKDKKVKEHIRRIEDEIRNSTAIIESLLSLSGIRELNKKHLNIITVLNEAIAASDISAKIEVVRDIPADGIFLKGDREQLCIVFQNIIKNAMEAMNNKGILTVRVEKKNNKQLKISFADTGAGITTENINKVFQPLFTTKVQGSGFGLSICKMIIEKHKGTINITSEEGAGTVVAADMPLA